MSEVYVHCQDEQVTTKKAPTYRFSKVALPSKKNTLSGIPTATFQRLIMTKSTIVASDPTTIEKMIAGRNLQLLMNV